jgi:hypothetical protein
MTRRATSSAERDQPRPRILVAGSLRPHPTYTPTVRDTPGATKAAEELGDALATGGCDLIVHSGRAGFLEESVVRGFIASGAAAPRSVHVRGRYGRDDTQFTEMRRSAEYFDVRPDPASDWEVAFYQSLIRADGVLLIGGGRSTFTAGVIAMTTGVPLVSVPAFGGAAEKIALRVMASSDREREANGVISADWSPGSATATVENLLRQHDDLASREDRADEGERRTRRFATAGLAFGLFLLTLALSTIPLAYSATPGTFVGMTALVTAPVLSAMCGAIARSSFDGTGGWLQKMILGAAAGAVAFLLFVGAQLAATPEILDGPGARRLLFFVLPIGFTAGLTFDVIYARLRNGEITTSLP